jgi:hypothetical protein
LKIKKKNQLKINLIKKSFKKNKIKMDFIKNLLKKEEKGVPSSSELKVSNYGYKVLIQVKPEEGDKRIENDIICVIDISGSMGDEAAVKNQ